MPCFQSRHRAKRSLPRLWLMTDERVPEGQLLEAVTRLPQGSGIVFRHYSLARADRRRLFDCVRAIARRRRLVLMLAGSASQARRWGADGFHGLLAHCFALKHFLHSASVHNMREIRRAERSGVQLLFLSPVFPTRSHPRARPLGRLRFGTLARSTRQPVIALGGITAHRARALHLVGAYGWAAIDGLTASARRANSDQIPSPLKRRQIMSS